MADADRYSYSYSIQQWSLHSAGCPLSIVPAKSFGTDGTNQGGTVRSSARCRQNDGIVDWRIHTGATIL